MQMKKNYLLLFLMALLFGTANMRGQSLPWSQLPSEAKVKIGVSFLVLTETEAKCSPQEATKLDVGKEKKGKKEIEVISLTDKANTTLAYNKSGDILADRTGHHSFYFVYVSEGGKYYLKPYTGAHKSKYLTNIDGHLTLEATPSTNAEVEITAYGAGVSGGSDGGGNSAIDGQKLHNILALFQFHHSESTEQGIVRTDGPFIGTGLGTYQKPHDNTQWNEVANKMFKDGVSPTYNDANIGMMTDVIQALKITPVTSGYVYVTTKSQFEDQVRDNTKTIGYSNTPIDNIPGLETSQPAKYLKATATGYELTTNKNEAAVFYFDGHHLTGLDYGFGLGTANYTQTEDNQKTVIGQGLLKKTLDAGSYSVKVGDKYVKLDNTDGLSLTSNESDSHLFLEEATKFTLHTNDLGYVSFFAPTAVQVPAGVKIFSGTLNTSGTQVVFTEVSGNQIPANTAVLLQKGTSKATFEVKKIATASPITNNSLKGYAVSSSDHKNNAYGMMVENGNLVFKRLSDAVRAFRAVVYKNAAGSTQEFIPTSFAPTGIKGVTVEENKEEIFDLTGRRVESPVKGQVYVKGGKKFIQK